jgi:hypothetical protein
MDDKIGELNNSLTSVKANYTNEEKLITHLIETLRLKLNMLKVKPKL